jgi:hypothetical protein
MGRRKKFKQDVVVGSILMALAVLVAHPGIQEIAFDVYDGLDPFRYWGVQTSSGNGLVGFEADAGEVGLLFFHGVRLIVCFPDSQSC